MKAGDMVYLKTHSWVREDPVRGNEVGKYPTGTVLVLLQDDDPELYHHKVLTPDGKIGWIFKDNVMLPS